MMRVARLSSTFHSRRAIFATVAATVAGAGTVSSSQRRHEQAVLLTPEQTADVANMVLERYSVPLLPSALQAVLVQKAVATLAHELEEQTGVSSSYQGP